MAGIPDEIPDAVAGAAKSVRGAAEQATEHPVVQTGARLGYVVSGLLHLVMGVLAVRLAIGDHSATADQSGALGALAATPVGWALLGLAVLGLGLLALWQFAQVLRRHPADHRLKSLAKGVAYAVLAAAALSFLFGRPTSSTEQTSDVTAQLMALPLGPAVVVVVGLAVIGVGLFHIVKGGRRGFLADLVEAPPPVLIRLAMIGYMAKGAALGVAGLLLLQAAWTRDPDRSTGLDGALSTLLGAPGGPVIVAAIGLGFAAYGVYSFGRARFART